MKIFNVLRHLLPNAKAWRLDKSTQLNLVFKGLAASGDHVKSYIDNVWLDIFPATTRELDAWDAEFGLLPNLLLSDGQRRARLSAEWKATGGQSPRYLQDTLQAHGFNVFVHEWWKTGSQAGVGVKACAVARDPHLVIKPHSSDPTILVECGEALAECGEKLAECGEHLLPSRVGYLLVNKLPPKVYTVPTDPLEWPYILYFGGQTYGQGATVPLDRRDEFETLCLKICPAQQWLGLMVTYV